jgi:hypothetical protein
MGAGEQGRKTLKVFFPHRQHDSDYRIKEKHTLTGKSEQS